MSALDSRAPPRLALPVARFLDDLRAAEAAGAEVLSAWIAVCPHEGLRGGLRAIGEREAAHAELLAERLAELDFPRTAAVSQRVRDAALARFGSNSISDEEKLGLVLACYPDDSTVARPIVHILEALDQDPETRELLRLVAEGETSTIAWLRSYHTNLSHPDHPIR